MTKVYFVRHAEPNYDNHHDQERELSAKGRRDRYLVSDFLKDKDISAVFSSPYLRAVETVKPFADSQGLSVQLVDDFRERKITDHWIEDFDAFSEQQWRDFTYKMPDGESLQEVQERNITALQEVLAVCPHQNVVIGSHGTALSTIINYFDKNFAYSGFEAIKNLMPWIVAFSFDEDGHCQLIEKINLFEGDR